MQEKQDKMTGQEFLSRPSSQKRRGTADPLPQRPIDVSYEDAIIVINDEVKKFLRSHPNTHLSRDECISIANESFVSAYSGHDPKKGPFLRRVRFFARHSITDHLRSQRNKIKLMQENEGLTFVPAKVSFDPVAFKESLSDDAVTVWWVARHLEDLERLPQDQKKGRLISALLEKGWNGDRIVNAFADITSALADWYRENQS